MKVCSKEKFLVKVRKIIKFLGYSSNLGVVPYFSENLPTKNPVTYRHPPVPYNAPPCSRKRYLSEPALTPVILLKPKNKF